MVLKVGCFWNGTAPAPLRLRTDAGKQGIVLLNLRKSNRLSDHLRHEKLQAAQVTYLLLGMVLHQ